MPLYIGKINGDVNQPTDRPNDRPTNRVNIEQSAFFKKAEICNFNLAKEFGTSLKNLERYQCK